MYRTLFHVNVYGSYKLSKKVQFFGPPCTYESDSDTTQTAGTWCNREATVWFLVTESERIAGVVRKNGLRDWVIGSR